MKQPNYTYSRTSEYVAFDGTVYVNKTSANFQGTRSGQVNNGWREKIARAQDASSPYSISFVPKGYSDPSIVQLERMDGSGQYRKRQKATAVSREWSTSLDYLLPNPSSSVVATLDENSLLSVKRKLTDVNASFKALVPLGELRETAHIVRDVNSATVDLLKTLIELKKFNFGRAYRAASKAWLTYSFGVKPLVGDLKQLCYTIADSLEANIDRQAVSVRGKASSTSLDTYDVGTFTDVLGIGYSLRRVASMKSRVIYSAGLQPFLRHSSEYGLDEQFGITLGDVLPAVWELTPWSWAIDYVTNIGDVVNDLFWSPPGRTVYLCKTVIHESNCILYATPTTYPVGSTVIQSTAGKHAFKHIWMNRSVLSSLPHVGARFKSFDEIAHNGLTKISYLASALYKPR